MSQSVYPAAFDAFTAPGATLGTNGAEHSSLHDHLADAVAAIQAELGLDPADIWATVEDRLSGIEFARPLAGGEVTSGILAAEAVIPTKLQQSTIWNPLHAAWIDYTHNAQNVSTGVGGVTARYKRIGSTMQVSLTFNFGAGSAITGAVYVDYPLVLPARNQPSGSAMFYPASGEPSAGGCFAWRDDGHIYVTEPGGGYWDSAAPLGGTLDGGAVECHLTYEVAPTAGTLA